MNNMYSLFSFLTYSEAQNRTLKSIDGVILYPHSKHDVPEYIHFLPKVLDDGSSLKLTFKPRSLTISDKFYLLYFNPIRWIVPDLGDTMRSLKRIPVIYGDFKISFFLSYGRITFDVTPELRSTDPEISPLHHVPLNVLDRKFFIDVMDLPDKMGIPKIFQKVEFKW